MKYRQTPAEVLSIPPVKLKKLLRFSKRVTVVAQTVRIAEKLIDSSVYCRANQNFHHQLSGSIDLDLLRKAYPVLGFCLLLWAKKNQILKIKGRHLLEAFASDFHYQRTMAKMDKIYIPMFGFKTSLMQLQFYLFDLTVGGELGTVSKPVLHYPSRKETVIVFNLREGEITPQNEGSLAVIHFGQIITPADHALVNRLQQIHQTETLVSQLFEKARQEKLRVPYFEVVVSGVK